MTLEQVAAANPGLAVDRVYLLGMGDSYHVGDGIGTVGWVDKVTIGDVTYDFVANTLSVSRTGNGTITSTPSGIACGTACSYAFDYGSSVTLSAAPATGWTFAGWSGACTGTGVCSLTMDAARSVSAIFWPVAGTQYISNLQPSWTAPGSEGVFSAYVAPPDYGYVSPGITDIYDGREAGIIKAGLTPYEDDHYDDEGLFGFAPMMTIDVFAANPLSFTVDTQYGENPVWMTIEVDTGVVGDRNDNTTYQYVPTSNPSGWHMVDAAAGQWVIWNDNNGDTAGNPLISLSQVAADNTGRNVVRVYLRLGMGDSYHGLAGLGTIAWVDQVTIGNVTFDFVANSLMVTRTGNGTVSSDPAGIDCGTTCTAAFDYNTPVTLSAVPATGWTFAGWSGACSGTGDCSLTMDAARSVSAIFWPVAGTQYISNLQPSWTAPGSEGVFCLLRCTTRLRLRIPGWNSDIRRA